MIRGWEGCITKSNEAEKPTRVPIFSLGREGGFVVQLVYKLNALFFILFIFRMFDYL